MEACTRLLVALVRELMHNKILQCIVRPQVVAREREANLSELRAAAAVAAALAVFQSDLVMSCTELQGQQTAQENP